MKRNINTRDRLLRLAIAIALLTYAWWQQSWIALAASLFTFYETLMGWCVLYALLGKSSCPINSTYKNHINPGSYININGQNIYYEVHGSGPPLMLIAGFTCNCIVWSSILRELSAHFKVIIFDNRGAGRSSCPDKEYSVEDMADDTAKLIEALDLGKVNVMGHSMGGAIAQMLAYKYPDKVNKLILACTSANFGQKCILAQRFVLDMKEKGVPRQTQIDYIFPWVYSDIFLRNESAVQTVKQIVLNDPYIQSITGFRRQFAALEKFDSRSWLKNLKLPTLVIYGNEDILCANDQLTLLKEIEGSEQYCFEGIGHLPHIEQPKRFAAAITNFL